MDFTLNNPAAYPSGTSVAAYPVSNWPGGNIRDDADPVGSATNTQTASGTGLTFTGLAANTRYVAFATVGGVRRYISFFTADDLGPAATRMVGTAAGTVAAGDDARLNRYRQVLRAVNRLLAGSITGAGDYTAGWGGATQAAATAGQTALLVYLDPAMGTKLRMSAASAVFDIAPGRTVIWGLYPVGTPSGTVQVANPNLGSAISASQVTFTSASLTANSKSAETVTADFACPTAGWYCFGANSDGAFTANSIVFVAFRLEQRD